MYDVAIIGAGVAGLMVAGRAAECGLSVVVLEKMERPARKLRITGKGRCNITNTRPIDQFADKIRAGAEFSTTALQEFDNKAVIRFFEDLGLACVEERAGRVFPSSGRATDVATTIQKWVETCGATIRCNCAVDELITANDHIDGVRLKSGETIKAKTVVITTGGVSYPRTGSTGDGYNFAASVGHSIEPLRPSLTTLQIADKIEHFKGLELRNIGVKLLVDNHLAAEKFGDVDFTDRSMGGATILQLSRDAVEAIIDNRHVIVELDLKPALGHQKLLNRINGDIEKLPNAPLRVMLDKLTPRPLHAKVAKQAQIELSTFNEDLTENQRLTLSQTLKSLRFNIPDYRPFSEAIITAGGVDLREVDPKTMRSKIVDNLYFAGEVLDIDADTGGYNIQLALSTARLAANCIAAQLGEK